MMKFYAFLFSILIVSSFTIQAQTTTNALDFDGTDDFVSITGGTALFEGLTEFSMCGWVYPTNAAANWPDFDGFFGIKDEFVCDFYLAQINGTGIEARITTNTGTYTINPSDLSAVTVDEWHHYALVYDGAELMVYLNGELDGSIAASGTIDYDDLDLTLGKLVFGTSDFYLDGKLDEVTIWSKALTGEEILEYQCITGDPSDIDDLTAYYDFNEEEGSVLPDYFENYDGELTNMDDDDWVESDVCESGYTITFSVTDEETGDPVEGADVDLDGYVKVTDVEGKAYFNNYDAGTYGYVVSREYYFDTTGEVTVVDTSITEDVILEPTIHYSITFSVMDDDTGEPVVGADVSLEGDVKVTDDEGKAFYNYFDPGTYAYTITKEDYYDLEGEVTIVDTDITEDVNLPPILHYSITFVVEDDISGDPIDSAVVNLEGVLEYTDEQGEVVYDGFLPGSYTYNVTKDGYILYPGVAEVVDDDLILEIGLAPVPTYSINFLVLENPGSNPVEGALVDVEGIQEYTDETGAAHFEGYLPGTYAWSVSKEGFYNWSGGAEVVDEDVTVEVNLLIDGLIDNKETLFALYPNPASNKVYLNFTSSDEINTEAYILDMSGRIIREYTLEAQNNRLDISGIQSGIYLVEVKMQDQKTTRLISIQ